MKIKERRYDMDWIRVIVFDLLILYHVGMFFVPWTWHLKNPQISEAFVFPMFFTNQWRLPILFVVSGMGTRFALSYRSGGAFVFERIKRLFIPLVFGVLLVVPPQVYFERIATGVEYTSYFQFYPDFFKGLYPIGNFGWHHLWFLPYLLTLSLICTPFFLWLRSAKDSKWLTGLNHLVKRMPWLLYGLIVPLIAIEIFLAPKYPITNGFVRDWYAFAFYGLFFVMGFVLISVKEGFWYAVQRIRFVCLGLGIMGFSFVAYAILNELSYELLSVVRIISLWSWVLTIFGFASKYLNRPSKILAYRNEAVYPFYIIHQMIVLGSGYYLLTVELPVLVKFIIMVVATYSITWILYEFLIRRVAFLRPLFGLRKKR